jgi:sirohydrochlorin ferrochelatase
MIVQLGRAQLLDTYFHHIWRKQMKAIILLGHGSRVPGGGRDMEKIVEILNKKYELDMIKFCYLSRLGPNFPEALATCVSQGAKKIIVIPYFLNKGLHILLDIPEMLQKEATKYPDVKVIYGKHFGYDDSFADIIYKRIMESSYLDDVRKYQLPKRDSLFDPNKQN